jgi:hypothetical protein
MTNPVTHLLWGYVISRQIDGSPRLIVLGLAMSVLLDIDALPMPGLEHHGFMHTLLFVAVISIALLVITRSRVVFVICTVNLLMHLVLDTIGTAAPVMWLYPFASVGFAIGTEVSLSALIAIKATLLAIPLTLILYRNYTYDENPLEMVDYLIEHLGRRTTYVLITLSCMLIAYIGFTEYFQRII